MYQTVTRTSNQPHNGLHPSIMADRNRHARHEPSGDAHPENQLADEMPREEGVSGSDDGSATELPEDGTLGGYMSVHERPPSFEGSDGMPYTVSVEIEQVGNLLAPFGVYLVFPRWSRDGGEVVGHVQTPVLETGRSHDEVAAAVGELTLAEVKALLEDSIGNDWAEGAR